MEVSAIPVNLDGAPAIMVVARDITERKRMQAQLLLADRMASLGTLAAGVAHEINNPLGYVIMNLDTIGGALPGVVRELRAMLDGDVGAEANRGHLEASLT